MWCEKQAAAWSVMASVVNYLYFVVVGDRHVGIYASPDNWRTCFELFYISIGLKERALEDSRYDLKRLEEQNDRLKAKVS